MTDDSFYIDLLDPCKNNFLQYGDGLTEEQVEGAMELIDVYMKASFEYFVSGGESAKLRALRDIAKKELMEYLDFPRGKVDKCKKPKPIGDGNLI